MIELTEILSKPMAISHKGLESLLEAAERIRSSSDPKAMLSFLFGEAEEERPYTLQDGVAVIEAVGNVVKRPPRWSWFQRVSTVQLREAIQAALEDPAVRAVLLDMESPGGLVDGTKDLADWIMSVRGQKPMHAFANGLMASAAYYIGAAMDEVTASPTAEVGSIGVLQLHVDWSKWNEKSGVKPTWLAAGRWKAVGNPDEPLSEADRKHLLDPINKLYATFVTDVARYRGLDPDKAGEWADGRTFLAQDALAVGLINQVETRQQLIERISKEVNMDLNELKTKHPALVTQIETGAREAAKADLDKAKTEAATNERERVIGICAAVLGDESVAKVKAVVATGATVDQVKALAGAFGAQAGQAKPEEAEGDKTAKEALELLGKTGANVPVGSSQPLTEAQKQAAMIENMAKRPTNF